jgi:cytochrome c biogenesis protein CcdA
VRTKPKSSYQTIVRALALVATVLILAAGAPLRSSADGPVHFYYFYDPNCATCQQIHKEVLEPLLATYGDRVVADERDMSDPATFEFLLSLEAQYQVQEPSIPEIFIGQDALIGPQEIQSRLQERVDYYLAQGGVALPVVIPSFPTLGQTVTAGCPECDQLKTAERTALAGKETPTLSAEPTTTPVSGPVIHAAWFYKPGCDLCERKEHDLQYVLDKYPQLQVRRFDGQEQTALLQYLGLRASVPEDRQLVTPALFVGDRYLIGEDIGGRSIEALIRPFLATGAAEPWAAWEANQGTAESTILERFRSLGLWTVIGAGLLDGINPCAFATMIFLISYLGVRKRRGRELLATGAAFTLGVFLAYLGVGLGLLKFLTSLPILSAVGKWVYGVTLLLCLALAWGSLNDFRKARAGRLEDMSLKLPERLRGLIRYLIREGSRVRSYVLASLLLGFVVSIVELACTGQVYLPTIIFVLGLPQWRARAALALVAYNLMFVTPLIIVFLLAYYGTSSQQLTRWMTRHAATVKLGTAILFLLMAAWLGYSIATL